MEALLADIQNNLDSITTSTDIWKDATLTRETETGLNPVTESSSSVETDYAVKIILEVNRLDVLYPEQVEIRRKGDKATMYNSDDTVGVRIGDKVTIGSEVHNIFDYVPMDNGAGYLYEIWLN